MTRAFSRTGISVSIAATAVTVISWLIFRESTGSRAADTKLPGTPAGAKTHSVPVQSSVSPETSGLNLSVDLEARWQQRWDAAKRSGSTNAIIQDQAALLQVLLKETDPDRVPDLIAFARSEASQVAFMSFLDPALYKAMGAPAVLHKWAAEILPDSADYKSIFLRYGAVCASLGREKAVAAIDQCPEGSNRRRMIAEGVCIEMSRGSTQDAATAAMQFFDGKPPAKLASIIAANCRTSDARGTFLEFLFNNKNWPARTQCIRELLSAEASEDLSRAASTALRLAESEDGVPATEGLIHEWVETDTKAASTWLSNLKAGGARDAGSVVLARALAGTAPSDAAVWAEAIQEPLLRGQIIREVYNKWRQADPDAANEWWAVVAKNSESSGNDGQNQGKNNPLESGEPP